MLGALMTAALTPVHALIVLVPAFAGLLWLIDGSRKPTAAFGAGWWFGFGYFALGLYWIAFALLTDAAKFGWMVPFAVLGLAAGFAVYVGLAALVVWWSGLRGLPRIVVLAAAWTFAEFARGHLFTGFPWNLIGQVWTFSDQIVQASAVVGVYGLGFVTVLAALLPALWWEWRRPAARVLAWALPAAVVVALWVGGTVRLADASITFVPDVRLRIVQPDIAQTEKWRPELRDQHLIKTMRLTVGPGWERVSHVVWPEAAIPFFIARDDARRSALAQVVPRNGLLVTGAPRIEQHGDEVEVWNALHAVDGSGTITATYDKFHLVPFGEFVPFRSVLPIDKITPGVGDFSAGPGIRTLPLAGLPPVSPLICYEAIFPGAVADRAARPEWLLNVTNDAWFGITAGPHQHFAAVRLRAVEEGLPLVRVANNGISALVDPFGRVLARLELGEEGILDVELPRPLVASTPFSRYGNWPILAALAALCAAFFLPSLIARRPNSLRR